MPNVKIEVRKGHSPQQTAMIIEAIHSAMMEALKIPAHDKTIRVVEYLPEHFAAPPTATENYTLVEIDMFSGRSLSAKKALYLAIVRNLGGQGIKPNDIKIVLRDIPAENWGIRGGIPASEVDLGFKIDV